MNQAVDIGLSSWSLGLNSPVVRHPFRRPALRHADFEDRYDFQTVFYDCFWSADGSSLRLIGPPLQNLADGLGLRFFAVPSGEELPVTILPRVFTTILLIPASPGLQSLRVESAAGTAFIVPQPNLSSMFAGRRVLMTLSQNNELEWIRDWIIYHQRLHGCDAALVYDNNSTRYDLSELKGCLAGIPGVTGLAVDWPFRYGPFDGRLPLTYDLWEGHFCQFGMLEHARYRFLADARCGLNLDIDELVVCPGGESICDLTESSATGFLKFGGKWVEPFAATSVDAGANPLHRHFRHRKTGRTQGCENKYTVVPSRVPDSAQFGIHDIFGHADSPLVEGVELRHFKAINTNWTVDRPGTLQKRSKAGHAPDELAEDMQLAALLDTAFDGVPASLDAPHYADHDTALYQARQKSAQLLRSGRPEAAEQVLRQSLVASPGWPSLELFHADLLDRLGSAAEGQALRDEAHRLQDADPAASYDRGRYLLHTGDWAGAARHLRRAIAKDSSFAPAHLALGRAYWSAGRQRAGEHFIRRGLAKAPSSALLHAALAEMLLYSGRAPAALDHVDEALLAQPENVRFLLLRSQILRKVGRTTDACAAAADAVKLQADNTVLIAQFGAAIDHPFEFSYPDDQPLGASIEYLRCLLQAEDLDAAEALSRDLLARYPGRVQACEARSTVLDALGRQDDAAEMLSQAIEAGLRELAALPPQTLGVYREREWHEGRFRRVHRLLQRAGRDDEASELLERELQLYPDSNVASLQLHDLLSSGLPPVKARERIMSALRRFPRDARLWQENARLLEAEGDRAGAIASYRNALQRGQRQAWLLSHLAQLLIRHSAERPEALKEAEDLLREALALDDRHALSHYRLGDVLWREKRKDEALAAWRTAAQLAPGEAWLWSHLGGQLVDTGELDEAEAALDKAIALKPDDALTHHRLSRLHQERKEFDRAIEHMSKALALEPGKASMWRSYSKLLAQAGHAEDSLRVAEKARSLG